MGFKGVELPATLVELATHRLRDAILGTLKPGDKIIEQQLCADFGISRAPLREALRLLAQQGWSSTCRDGDPDTALAPVRDALEVMRCCPSSG